MKTKVMNTNSEQQRTQSSGLSLGLVAFGASLLMVGCGGGGANVGAAGGLGAGSTYELEFVSNGFGQLLPHQVNLLSSIGSPGGVQVLDIRTETQFVENVRLSNPVFPLPPFPEAATLPNGEEGNHFMVAKFSSPLLVGSILSSSPALQSSNSFTGTVVVKAVDPVSGNATVIEGRAFINRQTYGQVPEVGSSELPFQTWFDGAGVPIDVDTTGNGIPDSQPGLGFPGTVTAFAGSGDLHAPDTLVFVVDSDQNLLTYETFPAGFQINMEIQVSALDVLNRPLRLPAHAASTVGLDTIAPEVRSTPPPVVKPLMTPAFMEQDVDPLTSLTVEFTEPIQPHSVGDGLWIPIAGLSTAIGISFGPAASTVEVPFHVRPLSVFDLTRWELIPAFNFPGAGPVIAECGVFSRVDVVFRDDSLMDLAGTTNTLTLNSYFETGEGPGLVNLPVTPDAIYIGRSGAEPAISVIDLHGFGAGTGNPTYDVANPIIKGNSNFPNNPNVAINGPALRPALFPGECTVDGGSAGVFTLGLDSSLNDKVVRAPVLQGIGDMMLGAALDTAFNNAPSPYGCQGGGGNLCASNGYKRVVTFLLGSSVTPGDVVSGGGGGLLIIDGGPNVAAWPPHPNPPPLIYPPLCVSPFIGGQEPTSIDTGQAPVFIQNLLLPGDNFLGNPEFGIPPDNQLARINSMLFQGPSLPQQNPGACQIFALRQQIGQYLYILDRGRNELVILNSNRMTVIERILMPDPTSMAMGTNVDLLAVSSQASDSVIFVDINPTSSTFHQLVKTISVGEAPRGIAWEAGNEDILVCNEGDNSVSVISAFSLDVRKVVTSGLTRPFEIAMTPRQVGFGLNRNVYFAYILGRNGRVSVFESGPSGVNGWGFDNVIGQIQVEFLNPKTIHVDPADVRSAFWVVHEGQLDQLSTDVIGSPTAGALTNMFIASGFIGQINISQNQQIPQIRDIGWAIKVSIGESELTGVPVDLAFDNQVNASALPNFFTNFSAGTPATLNGKAIVRSSIGPSAGIGSNQPSYMFAAVPNANSGVGGVDVIDVANSFRRFDTDPFEPGIQSITAPGATILMDYFRQ